MQTHALRSLPSNLQSNLPSICTLQSAICPLNGGLLTTAIVFLVIFVPMLLEASRARRNEHTQRARGGVEPPGDVYVLMRTAYPALFLAILGEGVLGGTPSSGTLIAGGALFGAAKTLKWWAIRSLGSCWTFRVIVVPGAPLVASGPYRYTRHPNYLAVMGEIAGAAVMTGARVTGPVAAVLFGALMLRRMAVENRALADAAARAANGARLAESRRATQA